VWNQRLAHTRHTEDHFDVAHTNGDVRLVRVDHRVTVNPIKQAANFSARDKREQSRVICGVLAVGNGTSRQDQRTRRRPVTYRGKAVRDRLPPLRSGPADHRLY